MENQKKKNKPTEKSKLSVKQMPTEFSRQLEITYSDDFPDAKKERQIHPRRKAPPTPKGKYVEDETPTDSIKIEH
jgi:hypothetical protein